MGALSDEDGRYLDELLHAQANGGRHFSLDEEDQRRLAPQSVRRTDRDVSVTVPEDHPEPSSQQTEPIPDVRESIRVQALLADIGSKMRMQIWIPRNDRTAVLNEWRGEPAPLLERLPLNYDEIGQSSKSTSFGFKDVQFGEHTTSVYSGILRMADLLALQPNMDIRLHIVAPELRRSKVFQEIRRPVFSLLERGPLSESCTFISYDSIRQLASQPHLSHLSNSVLEDYEEEAED